jgi:tRNA pseudouridine55 synthase
VQGRDLVPWCPARELDAEEADHLLHGRPIATGQVLGPSWPLPAGFPDPQAPVRGLQQGRLVALLRERDGALWTSANLRGGL